MGTLSAKAASYEAGACMLGEGCSRMPVTAEWDALMENWDGPLYRARTAVTMRPKPFGPISMPSMSG
jgi:hypothetical protein